jgi:hypothetical protein
VSETTVVMARNCSSLLVMGSILLSQVRFQNDCRPGARHKQARSHSVSVADDMSGLGSARSVR